MYLWIWSRQCLYIIKKFKMSSFEWYIIHFPTTNQSRAIVFQRYPIFFHRITRAGLMTWTAYLNPPYLFPYQWFLVIDQCMWEYFAVLRRHHVIYLTFNTINTSNLIYLRHPYGGFTRQQMILCCFLLSSGSSKRKWPVWKTSFSTSIQV